MDAKNSMFMYLKIQIGDCIFLINVYGSIFVFQINFSTFIPQELQDCPKLPLLFIAGMLIEVI